LVNRRIFMRRITARWITGFVVFGVFCLNWGTGFTPFFSNPCAAVAAETKGAWEAEWGKTVAAGQKEQKVVLATTFPPSVREPLGKAMKEKFAIDAEWLGGTSGDQVSKITTERQAGLYTTDICMFGVSALLNFPEGSFDTMDGAFILPEVKDVNFWRKKKITFSGTEKKLLMYLGRPGPTIAVNTRLVKDGDIKSWRDLLAPKWKGKMLMHDPSYPGAGNSLMTAVHEIMGTDYLRELAKQEPLITRDYRLIMEWVAKGKYPLTIGFNVGIMEDMRRMGAPVANVVPQEGTFFGAGIGAMGLLNRAPHPNAARVFINWLLSKEGQTLLCQAAKEQSNRVDIKPVLAPDRLPQEGIEYVDSDTPDFDRKRKEMFSLAKEVFAGLYK